MSQHVIIMTSQLSPTFSKGSDDFAREIHHYVRDYIQLADQKAGFILAAISALTVVAFNLGVYKSAGMSHWHNSLRPWNSSYLLALVAATSLTCSALAALSVVIPRFSSGEGIVFWRSIVEFQKRANYADAVVSLDPCLLTRALLEDTHDLAKVCRRKYRALRIAIATSVLGTAAVLLCFLTE